MCLCGSRCVCVAAGVSVWQWVCRCDSQCDSVAQSAYAISSIRRVLALRTQALLFRKLYTHTHTIISTLEERRGLTSTTTARAAASDSASASSSPRRASSSASRMPSNVTSLISVSGAAGTDYWTTCTLLYSTLVEISQPSQHFSPPRSQHSAQLLI